jgi:hypothetical protein
VGQCRSEHEAHLELLREAAEAEVAAAAAAVKGRYSPVVRTHLLCVHAFMIILLLEAIYLAQCNLWLFTGYL